jgi:hypothetical protein
MILRELLLKLGLDIDEAKFAKGHLAAELLEKGLERVVEIAKEAAEAFRENVMEVVEYGDRTRKAAQATGVNVEALQELQYAASLADINAEELNHSMGVLTRTMRGAKDGSEEQAKAFSKIGVHVKGADGKLRAADEVMGDIAEKFAKMPDGAEKTATAMQLFGKSGAKMIPLLNEGKDGLADMRAEAEELGLVISADTTKSAEEFNDTLTRIRAVATGLWRQAIAPLIPAMTSLLKRFLEWRKANAAIMAQNIQKYVGYLIKAINMLADAFSFLQRNAAAVYAIIGAGGLIAAMITLGNVSVATALRTAAAWLIAAAPFIAIGAIIAAILLVYDDLRTYNEDEAKHSKTQHSLYGVFRKRIDELYKDRPKPPILQHMIDLVEALRSAGSYLSQLMRDFKDFYNFVSPRAAAFYYVIHGAQEHNADEMRKGLSLLAEIQANDKPAIAGGNTLGSGGAPYVPGVSPSWRAPGGGNSRTHTTLAPVIQVYQQPGESQDNFVERVGQHVEDFWNSQMEEAGSGVMK